MKKSFINLSNEIKTILKFTNTGMAASENGNKRVLLYLGAARRILDVYTWPSSCSVQKCKFTNDKDWYKKFN